MKKLLFILAVGCITATVGCSDDDADNLYGDFNVPCELQLLTVKAKNGGGEFPLVLAEARDTVYTYTYTVNDTLKDETTGEPVIGSDGNYVITKVPQEYQGPIRRPLLYIRADHRADADRHLLRRPREQCPLDGIDPQVRPRIMVLFGQEFGRRHRPDAVPLHDQQQPPAHRLRLRVQQRLHRNVQIHDTSCGARD